jgi:hypothetical protein
MLDIWKGAYAHPATVAPPLVECVNGVRDSETLRDIEEVGVGQIGRMVEAWRRSGFLH